MTLGEGKRKVYELMDEYSSGGTVTADADIEVKMADFFDIAQKQVSQLQRLVKVYTVPVESGTTEYAMPADFSRLKRVWRNGTVSHKYPWKAGKLIITDGATVEVEYYAIPETVDKDTPDDYEFEVREDGCQAMCFYVAAQQLVVDLVIDYGRLYQMYQSQLALIETSDVGEGSSCVKNIFG